MALADHYRVLGLRTGASFEDVKLAYRNLARLYHPDVNPGDQRSKDKFIQITQAYRTLVDSLPQEVTWRKAHKAKAEAESVVSTQAADQGENKGASESAEPVEPKNQPSQSPLKSPVANPVLRFAPGVSAAEQQLKMASFGKLRDLFQSNRFPRAVALVEGLATRFPQDAEVRQWHAITYYRWGHDLIKNGNGHKAKACLNKSLRLDPHNKSLRQAVHSDLQQVEKLLTMPVA